MTLFLHIALAVLGGLALATTGLLLRRGTMFDRLLGFDMLGLLAVSALILVAIQRRDPFYLDLALALGGLGFVGTLAWARSLEKP